MIVTVSIHTAEQIDSNRVNSGKEKAKWTATAPQSLGSNTVRAEVDSEDLRNIPSCFIR
jgi:hypothetical protein